ncbi:MAG TPA: hypothetical protein VF220_02750, partial [Nitrososphaeraceae archaeon]
FKSSYQIKTGLDNHSCKFLQLRSILTIFHELIHEPMEDLTNFFGVSILSMECNVKKKDYLSLSFGVVPL